MIREEILAERVLERCRRLELQRDQAEARQKARRAETREKRELLDRLDSADRAVIGYSRWVTRSVDQYMAVLGYYRHKRGEWRRRQKTMVPELSRYPGSVLTRDEDRVRRAWNGDAAALETTLLEASRHHYSSTEGLLLEKLRLGNARSTKTMPRMWPPSWP